MRKSVILFFVGIATVMSAMTVAQTQPAPARQIHITAKKFEFDATKIEVTAGETIELTLDSLDSEHGFECKELGIKTATFQKGQPATVTFSATRPGTYEFKC